MIHDIIPHLTVSSGNEELQEPNPSVVIINQEDLEDVMRRSRGEGDDDRFTRYRAMTNGVAVNTAASRWTVDPFLFMSVWEFHRRRRRRRLK